MRFSKAVVVLAVMCGLHSISCFAENTVTPPMPATAKLTPDEIELLDRGEISDARYAIGGIVGTFLGLGLGNAIQGTYMPKGLIFTLGEIGGTVLIVDGVVNCVANVVGTGISNATTGSTTTPNCNGAAAAVGLVALLGFRVWELVDVWTTPPSINREIRNIRERNGISAPKVSLVPVMDPYNSSAIAGGQLSLTFKF